MYKQKTEKQLQQSQPSNKNWLRIAGATVIIGILAVASIFLLGRSNITPPAQTAGIARTAQLKDSTAPRQATADIRTPSPYVVLKASDADPNPAASETVPTVAPAPATATASATTAAPTLTPQVQQAQQAQATPKTVPTKKAAPAKKAAPGVATLPNGVRYGDHKPNLPGRIVRIASPNIRLDTPVYEVYAKNNQWEVADYAAGHNYNTKNPGEGGNIVLSGHNNWHGEVFRYLEFFKPGDEIDVWTLAGKQYKYKVEKVEKLKEAGASLSQRLSNGQVMAPTSYEQLTLITCWPYTTYTHRLIVTAKPVQ